MNENARSRKWQLTINNPLDHGFDHESIKEQLLKFKNLIYYCMCDETGEEGTFHTHVYFQCSEGAKFTTVKRRFPKAHLEYVKGTAQENRDYIRKEGKYLGTVKAETNHINTFEEYGELPVERKYQNSNEYADLLDMMKDGMSTYQIIEECPQYLLQLDKLERAILAIRKEKSKNEWRDVVTTYIWGPTGTGKTSYVMNMYGYSNVYRVTDYGHPFDGYNGEDIILFDEFHNSLNIHDMKKYLDGYPVEFPARYANKQAMFHRVFLTSQWDLKRQYMYEQREDELSWGALLRRIHNVIVIPEKGVLNEYKTTDYMNNGFSPLICKSPFDEIKEQESVYKQGEIFLE